MDTQPTNPQSITPRIEGVTGDFDMATGKLVCVKHRKYGCVELCFAEGWNIPFARIRLHTRDLARESGAVFDDACRLGDEIARRWNAAAIEPAKEEKAVVLFDDGSRSYVTEGGTEVVHVPAAVGEEEA